MNGKIRFNGTIEYPLAAYNRTNSRIFTCSIIASDISAVSSALSEITLIEISEDGKEYTDSDTKYTKLSDLSILKGAGFNEETRISYDLMRLTIEKDESKLAEKVEELEQIVNPTVNVGSMTLDEYKEYMVAQMGKKCQEIIFTGVEVELSDKSKKTFSFKMDDQTNWAELFNTAIATHMPVPYHADGQKCVLYDYMDVVKIYVYNNQSKLYNTTYCNALNMHIRSLGTKDAITAISYGQELPSDLKENMDMCIKAGQDAMQALLSKYEITIDLSEKEGDK